jgi:hypothetical protein
VDLLNHRVRVVKMARSDRTAYRLLKYARRGFWPYPGTVKTVYGAWLSDLLGRKRRGG